LRHDHAHKQQQPAEHCTATLILHNYGAAESANCQSSTSHTATHRAASHYQSHVALTPAAAAAAAAYLPCHHHHQTGLFQLVRDYDVEAFKNNVLALAATAKLYGVPTILTTSLEKGPNGPLLPEIRALLPNATLIPRPGEINAWDNTEFVNAVKVGGGWCKFA
jgi:hypothetical protein